MCADGCAHASVNNTVLPLPQACPPFLPRCIHEWLRRVVAFAGRKLSSRPLTGSCVGIARPSVCRSALRTTSYPSSVLVELAFRISQHRWDFETTPARTKPFSSTDKAIMGTAKQPLCLIVRMSTVTLYSHFPTDIDITGVSTLAALYEIALARSVAVLSLATSSASSTRLTYRHHFSE